jgi:hypothetical protein
MSDDVLDKRRPVTWPQARKPPQPAAARNDRREPYVALSTRPRAWLLKLVPGDGLGYSVQYSMLGNILMAEDEQRKMQITIAGFSFRLQGHRLGAIEVAIHDRACRILRAFRPDKHLPEEDETLPFIESIEVKLLRGDPADIEELKADKNP